MRKTLTITLAALVLTVPAVGASARHERRATPKKVIVANKTFTGGIGQADRWGNVQVTIVVKKTVTTVGGKKTTKRQITSIKVPVYPNHTDRSVFISNNALPMLVQEALKAQSTHIYIISGAYTSDAFATSLQAAIVKENSW